MKAYIEPRWHKGRPDNEDSSLLEMRENGTATNRMENLPEV